jgi:hypothetical protein
MESDLKDFIARHTGKSSELDARLRTVEQSVCGGLGGAAGSFNGDDDSIGDAIIRSEGFAALVKGARSSGRIPFKSLSPRELKIISGSWSAVPDFRPVVAFPPQPALPVRALMPQIVTQSNLVKFLL